VGIPAKETNFNDSNETNPLLREALRNFKRQMDRLTPDKPQVVTLASCAIMSCGHLLLEDVPGIGKTTFIKAIAKLLGLSMKRVQFTSDVLPADIIGHEVYDPAAQKFSFQRGPVFSQILLADELNRASPRTQSALLEAMGEGSVTVNGHPEVLPRPFIVFATQNPNESIGTYPLPESQLDRFSARIKLDYPGREREEAIFRKATLDPLANVPAGVLSADQLASLQADIDRILVADRIVSFVKRIVDATRQHEAIKVGVSTRGGVSWLRMAKARALLEERNYVIPDDLIYLAPATLGHRISTSGNGDGGQVILQIIAQTQIE